MKRFLLLTVGALALAACGSSGTAAVSPHANFRAAHAGKYCDRAEAVKRDIEAKGWTYERDDDGPAGSTRVKFRRRGVTLVVDYDSTGTLACIVGKSYDQ